MIPRLFALDLETTGLPNGRALDDPAFPRMIQIGGVQWDRGDEPFAHVRAYVRQEDARVSKGAERVHGISDRIAASKGMPERLAVAWITNAVRAATHVIGWNLSFNLDVVRSALIRHGQDPETIIRPGVVRVDLMQIMTPIVGKQDDEGRQVWPSLSDGYRALFGSEIAGQHDAYRDAMACREIFERLCERDFVPDMRKEVA
jgi:DNA polymerase-3 subunit alpha